MHQKKPNLIPEVAACGDFQALILKSIDLSATHADYYRRRIKVANQALVLVFSAISNAQFDIARPLAELTNGFIRSPAFKNQAAYEQAMCRELFRRTVELLRKDMALFLQSLACDTLVDLTNKLVQLGQASRAAYLKQNEANADGTV